MPSPLNLIAQGSYTSDAGIQRIDLADRPAYFELYNRSQFGSAAATTPVMKVEWRGDLTNNSTLRFNKTNGAATLDIPTSVSGTAGIHLVDTSDEALGAAIALNATFVTQANPAVVTTGNTAGLSNGDIVRLQGTTTMLQASGMEFQIAALVANTSFTLAYLDSSGFAAAATAGSYRRIGNQSQYAPRRRFLTAVTQAGSAVCTTSVDHGYSVGEVVRFNVATEYGMSQMNGLQGEITAVTASTFTVDVDSTAFTAFAFPTSAQAAGGVTQAHVELIGALGAGNVFTDAVDNVASYQIVIPAVQNGGAADVMEWMAFKGVDA